MEMLPYWLGSVICFVLAALMIYQDSRRAANGFLLEGGVLLGLMALLQAFSDVEWVRTVAFWLFVALYVLLALVGVGLVVNGYLMFRREGKSLANLLPFPFGVLTIVVAVVGMLDLFGGLVGSQMEVFLLSVGQNLVLYTPLALGGFLLYALVYALLPKNPAVDFIVVLGCMIRKDGTPTPLLRGRLDKAISFWEKGGRRANFIVSGGQGANEVISEAASMRQYLLDKGVPQAQILVEDQSRTTRENLLFSSKLMGEGKSGVLCTSSYHVLRAVMLARQQRLPLQGVGGHTAAYYLPAAFFREYLAVVFSNKVVLLIYFVLAVALAWVW